MAAVAIPRGRTPPIGALTPFPAQCSNSLMLTGGRFRFTGGDSVLQGQLLVMGNPTLSATGALTSFTVVGPVAADGAGFEARDPGSALNLPGLSLLTGATCGMFDIHAWNGGQLLLGRLTNIAIGTAYVLASGGGSLIDLSSLASFINPFNLSRLVATNGGTILLGTNSTVLSGVSINVARGTPNLPQTILAATNLVLHGKAWHSYWIERRDTASPLNPWTFLKRLPLTNEFQIIAPPASGQPEFRAWEFVADPFALELTAVPAVGVNVVFYGDAGTTFDVLATTNLTIPWEPFTPF